MCRVRVAFDLRNAGWTARDCMEHRGRTAKVICKASADRFQARPIYLEVCCILHGSPQDRFGNKPSSTSCRHWGSMMSSRPKSQSAKRGLKPVYDATLLQLVSEVAVGTACCILTREVESRMLSDPVCSAAREAFFPTPSTSSFRPNVSIHICA